MMRMRKAAGSDGGEETRAEHGRTEGQVVVMILHYDGDGGGGGFFSIQNWADG